MEGWDEKSRGIIGLEMNANEFLQHTYAILQRYGPDHMITIGFIDIDGTHKIMGLSIEDTGDEWEEGKDN